MGTTADGQDKLTQVTDADGVGNLIRSTSPDTGTTNSTSDAAGNLMVRTDAQGQPTSFQYDALNRVTSVGYSDGTSTTYMYDQGENGIGRLSQVSDVSGVIRYGYDVHGRVVSDIRTIGANSYLVTYRYGPGGRLVGLIYPSGRSVDYTRDSAGRITAISTTKDGGSMELVTQAAYQPFGPLRAITFGNGQVYTRAYDLDGRMTSYTLNGQVQTVSYDAASRITGISDAGSAANNRTYGYDQLDHLTSEQRTDRSLIYSYDAVGNRTQYVNGAAATNYTYAAASNRLTQVSGAQINAITMDLNGNTTGDGNSSFNYDARGRMVSANTAIGLVSYTINALAQRVQKTTPTSTTVFQYDSSGKLIAETTDGATTEYVYLDDVPVAVLNSGGMYYIQTDQLDTPRIVTDANAVPVWTWDSDPFGSMPPNETPTAGSRFAFALRFPGQFFDSESYLFYNYYRDYDPQTGRYIQSDPIGLRGGINTYAYVRANPTGLIDPFGLADINLFKSAEPSLLRAGDNWNPSGVFSVAGHGSFYNMSDSNDRILWPDKLAKMIRDNPNFHGQRIVLGSCLTGRNGPDPKEPTFAQRLANYLGVPVTASTTLLYPSRGDLQRIPANGVGPNWVTVHPQENYTGLKY